MNPNETGVDSTLNGSFRRVVTEHRSDGLAHFRSDDELTPQPIPSGEANFALVWTTQDVPADNNHDLVGDKGETGLTLRGGSVIRVVDMLPGKPSPMHRTFSIDYGIVLSGELELELDSGEIKRLAAGDIVIQRGTNHLWRNPSKDKLCRIAFILIAAGPVRIGDQILPELHPEEAE